MLAEKIQSRFSKINRNKFYMNVKPFLLDHLKDVNRVGKISSMPGKIDLHSKSLATCLREEVIESNLASCTQPIELCLWKKAWPFGSLSVSIKVFWPTQVHHH